MNKKIVVIFIIGIFIISGIGANAYSITTIKNNDTYDMVVIAPNEFSSQIKPLINHKNNHNIITFLKTTEQIYSEYNGRDNAEQIKYFIKDVIETYGIEYVLLIGGHKNQLFLWYVPVRIVQDRKSVV